MDEKTGYLLLLRRIEMLEGAVPLARAVRVAAMQGFYGPAFTMPARKGDIGVFEKWPHP